MFQIKMELWFLKLILEAAEEEFQFSDMLLSERNLIQFEIELITSGIEDVQSGRLSLEKWLQH